MENATEKAIDCYSLVMDEFGTKGVLCKMQNRGRLLSFGYSEIDSLQQLRTGRTYLFGARPGMGKTTFAINIAVKMAMKKGLKVLYFTNNLTAQMIAERMIGIAAGVPFDTIKLHEFRPSEWEFVDEAARQLKDAKIIVNDKPNLSIDEIDGLLNECSYQDTDVVIFDEISYGNQESGKVQNSDVSLSRSQSIKRLAVEHDVAVIAFCTLGRHVEKKRTEFRPSLYMGDLREGWSHNWDVVGFLYRDEYYHRDSALPKVMEIILHKSFQGPEPGTVLLKWDRTTLRIGE